MSRELQASLGKLAVVFGLLWSLPITLAFFVPFSLFWLFGWYKLLGRRGWAFVWVVTERMPEPFLRMWDTWIGATIGTIVILRTDPTGSYFGSKILSHELEHARQYMIFGPLFVPLYALMWVVCAILPGTRGFNDNPFEISARRAAGQYVDSWPAAMRVKDALEERTRR